MRLFLDLERLRKAAAQMGAGRITEKEDQSSAAYNSSYGSRPEGVAAGEVMDPDDPKVGGRYPSSEGSSVVEESDAKREAREKKDDDDEDDVQKSDYFALTPTKETFESTRDKEEERRNPTDGAKNILKSLSYTVQREFVPADPHPKELEFLLEHGYDRNAIQKGLVQMTPRLERLFTNWLCDKLTRNPSDILGR